jgi:hypothetical protein
MPIRAFVRIAIIQRATVAGILGDCGKTKVLASVVQAVSITVIDDLPRLCVQKLPVHVNLFALTVIGD